MSWLMHGRWAMATTLIIVLAAYPGSHRLTAGEVRDDSSFDETWSEFVTIAGGLYDLGRYELAEENFERALKIANEHFAPGDPRRALTYRNVALSKSMHGDFSDAEPYAERAVSLCELAENSPPFALATNLALLGSIYVGLKEFEKADATLSRSLALNEKLLAADDPHLGHILLAIGETKRLLGKSQEAEEIVRRAISVTEKSAKVAHKDIHSSCLGLLGLILHDRGADEEAKGLLERAVSLQEEIGGPYRIDLVRPLVDRADFERETGKLAGAEVDYRRALAIGQQRLNSEAPTMKRARTGYAGLLRKAGRAEEAKAIESEGKPSQTKP